MKKLFWSFNFIICTHYCIAQNFQQQSRQLLFYNAAVGALTSGIGSAIHKHKSESITHAFVGGFWKGCIGGAVVYEAKDFSRNMNKSLWYGWGSTLMNAAGTSIINNGITNDKIFASWQMEVGFIQISTRNSIQLRPFALGAFIATAMQNRFDFSTSVKTGKLFFISDKGASVTHINSINISKEIPDGHFGGRQQIIIHEFIHLLQEEQFVVFNNYYSLKFMPRWIFTDIPFSDIFYFVENRISPPRVYNSNIFEFEANHFSVGKCLER